MYGSRLRRERGRRGGGDSPDFSKVLTLLLKELCLVAGERVRAESEHCSKMW